MYILIGTVDGKEHRSEAFDLDAMQEAIDNSSGYIFDGDLANERVDTPQEAVETLTEFLKHDAKNDRQTFNMVLQNGNKRNFNVRHVVWWDIVK